MSFDEFCYTQNLSSDDKSNFRRWLGEQAGELHTEWEWLRLFHQFLMDDMPRRARV